MNIRNLSQRLMQSSQRQLQYQQQRLGLLSHTLHAHSPLQTLARGYAIATHKDHILTHSTAVAVGDPITIRLQQGSLDCEVTSCSEHDSDSEF